MKQGDKDNSRQLDYKKFKGINLDTWAIGKLDELCVKFSKAGNSKDKGIDSVIVHAMLLKFLDCKKSEQKEYVENALQLSKSWKMEIEGQNAARNGQTAYEYSQAKVKKFIKDIEAANL